MWTRARIKTEAKNSLRRFGYWVPFLVTFVSGFLITGYSGGFSSSTGSSVTTEYTQDFGGELTPGGFAAFLDQYLGEIGKALDEFFSNPLIALTTAFIIILAFLLGLAVTFAWSAFISGPIAVGKNRYFMEHRGFETKFTRLFWAFSGGRYMNVVKIMFWKDIKIFLWSLLFIIPGIIKSYEYCMVPYLLAENPQMSSKRAFELSKQMTNGEKWKIFILELSFLGWILLGVLCCCVGNIFLMPYIEATFAELYQVMREKAHGFGFSNYTELPGFFPEQR